MKNLIGMTDFVLEIERNTPKATNFSSFTAIANYEKQMYSKIISYANFLKQPLELWMFIPCDEDGTVLENPHREDYDMYDDTVFLIDIEKYQQAKERCLFDDYSLEYSEALVEHWKTIEDLVQYNLRLTPTALKQIGL